MRRSKIKPSFFLLEFGVVLYQNKDKNVHKFALSAIRGELLERERERAKREQRESKKR